MIRDDWKIGICMKLKKNLLYMYSWNKENLQKVRVKVVLAIIHWKPYELKTRRKVTYKY